MTRKYLDDDRSVQELIRAYGGASAMVQAYSAIEPMQPGEARHWREEVREFLAEIDARIEYMQEVMRQAKQPRSKDLLDQRTNIVRYIRGMAEKFSGAEDPMGIGKAMTLVFNDLADQINTFQDQQS